MAFLDYLYFPIKGLYSDFPNFFKSERSIEGKKLGQQLLNDIDNFKSSFSDINTVEDVYNKFGVKKFDVPAYMAQVYATYDPSRRALANARARALSSIADKIGSRSATPGMKFAPAEMDFASQFAELEGRQASDQLKAYDKEMEQTMRIANLFRDILSEKDKMQLEKTNEKIRAISTYLNSLSGTSPFEDVTSGLSIVAQLAKLLAAGG